MALTLWHFGGAHPLRWRMRAALKGPRRLLAAALALSTLASCALGPDFKSPPPPPVSGYLPAGNRPLGRIFVPGADIPPRWWELFRSRHLNDLVEMGIAHNTDLQAAEAAVRVAQANALAQRGALFPQVAANWNSSRQQTPVATLQSNAANNAEIYSLHTAQVTVSYALDVWGGTRRQVESLEALAEAQAFQREGVYLTLTANIALAAIQEASLRGQIAATRRLVSLQTRLLDILRRQNSLGQIALPDVLVQETAAAQARMLLPPLERQLDQQRHLLATLTGRFPSEATAATFQLGSFRLPRQLPLSLPADLVCQRPDVRAAEANVHAANAQIGVAIANRLPQITLSGNDGSTALAISKLFSPGTNAWTIAGNALQPVFDGGTLRYKQQGAEEAWVQSVAQYRSTVLVAFQNVADVLRALQADARALNAAVMAEQAAQRSFDLVRRQLEQGQVSLPILLSAQQAYLQTSLARVQAEAARLADTVALFQALGGGWWNRWEATIMPPD
jgi:NodT family efflux transporter outer membrane factor (OMF) lipoprotein